MRFEEYRQLVKRTCPDLGSFESNTTHMLLGMMTEAGELADIIKRKMAYDKPLDWINIVEEIGDFLWYLANLANFLSVDVDFEPDNPPARKYNEGHFIDAVMSNFYHVSEIRNIIYIFSATSVSRKKQLLSKMKDCFRNLNTMLSMREAYFFDLSMGEVLEKNIAKLQARYAGQGFSKEEAVNRDTNKERQILENR